MIPRLWDYYWGIYLLPCFSVLIFLSIYLMSRLHDESFFHCGIWIKKEGVNYMDESRNLTSYTDITLDSHSNLAP